MKPKEEENEEQEENQLDETPTCSEGFHWDDVLLKCVENVG